MFQLHGAGSAPSFDRPVQLPVTAPLTERLDAVLRVMPGISAVALDPAIEALARPLDLGPDLPVRRARLDSGRQLSVVSVPSRVWAQPNSRLRLFRLKAGAKAIGRPVLLAPEMAVSREPLLSNALLIARCATLQVPPADHFALLSALVESGGELPMADAVVLMTRAEDPVAAILASAARRVVAIEIDHPLGPGTRVLSRPARLRP